MAISSAYLAFVSLFVATAYAQTLQPASAPSVLIEIARCESGMQQFWPNGKLVRDSVTGTHVGLFQISEDWIPIAKKRGDDIYTATGNIAFALYLYRMDGTRDWNASKSCWSAAP